MVAVLCFKALSAERKNMNTLEQLQEPFYLESNVTMQVNQILIHWHSPPDSSHPFSPIWLFHLSGSFSANTRKNGHVRNFLTWPLHYYLCLYPVYSVIKRHPIIAHAQNLCFFISFRLLVCDYSKSCILFRLIPSVDILWNNADVVGCKIPLTPSKISPALKVTINR